MTDAFISFSVGDMVDVKTGTGRPTPGRIASFVNFDDEVASAGPHPAWMRIKAVIEMGDESTVTRSLLLLEHHKPRL